MPCPYRPAGLHPPFFAQGQVSGVEYLNVAGTATTRLPRPQKVNAVTITLE